jgi:translation elongation factor EF-Tu-like GTPase
MSQPVPDIEAEIRFLSLAEGGGPGPYRNRLHTTHDFGLGEILSDAMHLFQDKSEVLPGETVGSQMSFLYPEAQEGRLYEGFTFTVQEGRRVIGHGRVTKVLNEALLRR